MPDRKRPGLKGVYIELPEQLHADFRALAQRNGRAFKVEVVRAMERYLKAPEVITVQRVPEGPAPKPRRKKEK